MCIHRINKHNTYARIYGFIEIRRDKSPTRIRTGVAGGRLSGFNNILYVCIHVYVYVSVIYCIYCPCKTKFSKVFNNIGNKTAVHRSRLFKRHFYNIIYVTCNIIIYYIIFIIWHPVFVRPYIYTIIYILSWYKRKYIIIKTVHAQDCVCGG